MNKSKIITVINYKGGVGKTTSAFNLAVSLRKIYESQHGTIEKWYLQKAKKAVDEFSLKDPNFKKNIQGSFNTGNVLLIDLDPQSSLSKLCLKKVKYKTTTKELGLEDLEKTETVNYIFKSYIYSKELGIVPKFNINKLVKTNKYNIDFIPSTMYYFENGYNKGLDNLEIEISRSSTDLLFNLTMLSKFIHDNKIDQMYDYIIFDCPPANNIITQNALAMSDYYLIPTIMDDLSANGIPHLHNLIQKTILGNIQDNYSEFIKENSEGCYLKFLAHETDLLGIFETLRDPRVKNTNNEIRTDLGSKYKVFEHIAYDYNSISNELTDGMACIDIDFSNVKYDVAKEYYFIACEVIKKYII